MRNHWLISRRTALKGLGVSLMLPLLDQMGWAETPAKGGFKPPVRLCYIYIPYGTHVDHFHLEQLLHRLLDFSLVGVGADLKHQRLGAFLHRHGFFRDDGADEDFVIVHCASASDSFLAAASLTSTCLWASRS